LFSRSERKGKRGYKIPRGINAKKDMTRGKTHGGVGKGSPPEKGEVTFDVREQQAASANKSIVLGGVVLPGQDGVF